ncbi:hypothetical protein D3H35_03135 [Cohnella faecalis]|uniref:Uncharacterized protein n=1 Tax=Cohnella faecalis TaxID=2315694 RepID=A0A398D0W0_9BACL|nr:hypothetical protein D3H35_03135 [Cohnella faecalis]
MRWIERSFTELSGEQTRAGYRLYVFGFQSYIYYAKSGWHRKHFHSTPFGLEIKQQVKKDTISD